jgi:hypothetical protein
LYLIYWEIGQLQYNPSDDLRAFDDDDDIDAHNTAGNENPIYMIEHLKRRELQDSFGVRGRKDQLALQAVVG